MPIRTYSLSLFILSIGLLLPLHLSLAQAVSGVKIEPGIIEDSADPNDVLEESLTITNSGDTEQTFYLVKKDIRGVEGNGVPLFAEEGAELTGYELSSWITISEEPVILRPEESTTVPFTITVPENAGPGSHFGGVFVTIRPPRLRQSGASVGYEVGAIISIRISGDVIESARIREFSTDKLVYSTPNVSFLVRVENPGNVLIRPRGPLEINNMFGKRVALMVMNDTLAGVFPGTIRSFEMKWEGEGVAFGRYQAIVGLVYGEAGRQSTVSATVSFWILPAKIILPILGGLALVVLVLYLGVKLYIRRTLNELSTSRGVRRVARRQRRDAGISRLAVVAVTLLAVTAIFLIGLLVLFA